METRVKYYVTTHDITGERMIVAKRDKTPEFTPQKNNPVLSAVIWIGFILFIVAVTWIVTNPQEFITLIGGV